MPGCEATLRASRSARMALDLVIVGGGPAGISTAVEAREAGIERDAIVILEKGPAHSYAIRKF